MCAATQTGVVLGLIYSVVYLMVQFCGIRYCVRYIQVWQHVCMCVGVHRCVIRSYTAYGLAQALLARYVPHYDMYRFYSGLCGGNAARPVQHRQQQQEQVTRSTSTAALQCVTPHTYATTLTALAAARRIPMKYKLH